MPSDDLHAVGSPRLQQWTTTGVNILAGLRCLIVENNFLFLFVRQMVGAWSGARPPGQLELRKLGKMCFLPKNRPTYVEMW